MESVHGFVFAFYRFSRVQRPWLIERVVHAATGNDAIHVAFVPATMKSGARFHLAPHAYTAFMGKGVVTQPTAELLGNGEYTYVFMPARDLPTAQQGVAFLNQVVGARYNSLSLVATLLPAALKGSIPRWISCENERHMPSHARPKLFCSQLGLMLCHVVDGVRCNDIDPAACSPGDLEAILHRQRHCVGCAPHQMWVAAA